MLNENNKKALDADLMAIENAIVKVIARLGRMVVANSDSKARYNPAESAFQGFVLSASVQIDKAREVLKGAK
jgi:hypothetical protein